MVNRKRVLVLLVVMVAVALSIQASYAAPQEQTAGRIIQFAGLEWYVKAGEQLGPGPNDFSDDAQSVWVDDSGKLHLKIRNVGGIWQSAEVYSTVPAPFGTYQFYVETPMHNLDPNVVLGLFLYQDLNNEIDVEVARWGIPDGLNAQFVVQPYQLEGHREQYELRWDGPTIFEFNWQLGSVHFRSMGGQNPDTALVIHEWDFAQGPIPVENPEMLLRMNLWLNNPPGAPANGQETEVVITKVESPLPSITAGQGCGDLRLDNVILTLMNAQSSIGAENWDEARAQLAQAQTELARIEGCLPGSGDLTPTAPAVTPPPSITETPPSEPVITIDSATANRVQGRVQPADFCTKDYKLALYAGTNQWYVQPYDDTRRNVPINADCTWVSDTHSWTYLAVHLVPANYDIPTVIFSLACPGLSDSAVLAFACWP